MRHHPATAGTVGTKVGALFGEAVVIANEALKRDFRYSIKRHGGMLAKGRLLGIQFATLFTDGLYMHISRHAIAHAMRIRQALQVQGIPFLIDSPTNQQFPILSNEQLNRLSTKYLFSIWQKVDDRHTAVAYAPAGPQSPRTSTSSSRT